MLFPVDVKDIKIQRMALYRIQQKTKHVEELNFKARNVKLLWNIYCNKHP